MTYAKQCAKKVEAFIRRETKKLEKCIEQAIYMDAQERGAYLIKFNNRLDTAYNHVRFTEERRGELSDKLRELHFHVRDELDGTVTKIYMDYSAFKARGCGPHLTEEQKRWANEIAKGHGLPTRYAVEGYANL